MTDAELIVACMAAGFITPDRQVRRVLGTLPLSADGCIVGEGAVLHRCTSFPRKETSMVAEEVSLMTFDKDTEDFSWVPFAESYASKEAALAAGLAYNERIRNSCGTTTPTTRPRP